MTPEEKKTLSELLKFSEGIWAELLDSGFADKKSPAPWQFKRAKAALTHPTRNEGEKKV